MIFRTNTYLFIYAIVVRVNTVHKNSFEKIIMHYRDVTGKMKFNFIDNDMKRRLCAMKKCCHIYDL